ncbi:putative c6 transcription factor [Phaeomoniella chlamydospora]|uniref:Putative c6 transcription factor n=1 Tax=Phaeomoniella chlamydospora TaxID=158046 RepID=A0A0G2EG05_PHACM|nr:putative c6 transcription factor [Phaeomoniella chlamydospora]
MVAPSIESQQDAMQRPPLPTPSQSGIFRLPEQLKSTSTGGEAHPSKAAKVAIPRLRKDAESSPADHAKQFGTMAEKLVDYETLLLELSAKVNEKDADRIRKALEKETSKDMDDIKSDAPTATGTELESEFSGGESEVSGGVGSTGAVDRVEEDFNRNEESRATGFMGKNSEVTWMQRLRQENRLASPTQLGDERTFQERSGGASALFDDQRGQNSGPPLPDVYKEYTVAESSYHLDDFGVSVPDTVDPYEVPPKETADSLFGVYMTTVHPSFPLIGKVTFASQYRRFFGGPRINPGPKWLSILNLIFAISARYSHLIEAPWRGDERDHLIYFTRARMLSMNDDTLFAHPDLQQIQIEGLMAFYLTATNQINRAWTISGMATRAAVGLGLNMRNESTRTPDTSKEIRYREVVNFLYTPEAMAMSWAKIQDTIVYLEDRLDTWLADLPSGFDFTRKQREQTFLQQRISLGFYFYGARITVNRPCLCRLDRKIPRQSDKSKEFNRQRAATCIDAARAMLDLIPDQPNAIGLNKLSPWWCILHFMVQATTVLMLELSFRADHMPEQAESVLIASKKGVRWLYQMSENSIAAGRAWKLCDTLLRDAAPKVGGSVDDMPTERTAAPTAFDMDPSLQLNPAVDLSFAPSTMSRFPAMQGQLNVPLFTGFDQYMPSQTGLTQPGDYYPITAEMDFLTDEFHNQIQGQPGYISSTATGNSTGTTVTETDTNGCSTLYTPVTTPVCQTTLSGMGQLPITVTACSQYVTFSTSTSTEIPVSTVSGSPMGANVAYFLADWRVIASGVVPNNVTVEDCVQGSGGQDCSTSTESWSVTTETYDVPFTSTITFEGMVTGPAILALGNGLYTTTIDASITQPLSINTVIITATPSPRPSIVRIGGVTTTVTIRSTVTSTVEVVNAYTPGPSTVASVQTAASVNTSAVV